MGSYSLLSFSCVPTDLIERTTHSALKTQQAWRVMRSENNWSSFKPLLKETFQYVKECAQIRAEVFNLDIYDSAIDEFNHGITQNDIDPVFDKLKSVLPDLIQEVMEKQKSQPVLKPIGNFSISNQKQLSKELMKILTFDFEHGRLDTSHHPFCGGIPQDVRLTTRYDITDFTSSLMAVCHETGHAKYEQQLPKKYIDQPVGKYLNIAIHESQSLLIEMQACRTLEFMRCIEPLVINFFGDKKEHKAENLYKIYTKVEPGLIRVDADEVCYPLHVIMRYEIEKNLFHNKISIDDLPEVWDNYMKRFFDINTENNYKDGVMQDVHWPSGGFGYFPAYSFGSMIAAQLFKTAQQEISGLLGNIEKGDFHPLFNWLEKNIHSKGSLLTYHELIKSVTGEALNPDYFLSHLKNRYLNI